MHKMEFGQAYCQDLIKSILQKITMYFSKLYSIFYDFKTLIEFMKIQFRNWFQKKENDVQYWAAIRLMALWARLGPVVQAAWPAHDESMARARSPRRLGGGTGQD
jgi:hypothetical protein